MVLKDGNGEGQTCRDSRLVVRLTMRVAPMYDVEGACYELFHLRSGRAHLEAGAPERASTHLELARRRFDRDGNVPLLVECVDLQARSWVLQERGGAVELAEEAVRRCRSQAEGVAGRTYCRALTCLGRATCAAHEWRRSLRALSTALRMQDNVRDLAQIGEVHVHLGAVWLGLGQLQRALDHARKASRYHAAVGDDASVLEAQQLVGATLVRLGRLTPAGRVLRRALGRCQELRRQYEAGPTLLALADLGIAYGDPAQARTWAVRAAEVSEQLGRRLTLARALERLGWLAERAGDRRMADEHLGRALDLVTAAGAVEWEVEHHARYARLLEARGESQRALHHYKHAALRRRNHAPELPASGSPARAERSPGRPTERRRSPRPQPAARRLA